MSDFLFGLVAQYGALVVLASTYLSCLALPVPSSFVMLAAGAFVGSGDLAAAEVLGAAALGAVAGDQTGFWAGRLAGRAIEARLARVRARAAALDRARAMMRRWGGVGVFFTTWAVSPLGPYVNLLAGGTAMRWLRFTLWDAAGETVWVTIYVGLGYGFGGQIATIADLVGNWVAFLSLLVVTLLLGALLLHRARRLPPT
ncbi:DedA family protein [Rhodobacteraceae bacterium WD3A24]|nr:DedA family protein [Rhodobacteraceae bacterium WD3A24]